MKSIPWKNPLMRVANIHHQIFFNQSYMNMHLHQFDCQESQVHEFQLFFVYFRRIQFVSKSWTLTLNILMSRISCIRAIQSQMKFSIALKQQQRKHSNENENEKSKTIQPTVYLPRAFLFFVVCISGAQWGDEGKGKVVDMLATEADVVCRCQVRLYDISFLLFLLYTNVSSFLFYYCCTCSI